MSFSIPLTKKPNTTDLEISSFSMSSYQAILFGLLAYCVAMCALLITLLKKEKIVTSNKYILRVNIRFNGVPFTKASIQLGGIFASSGLIGFTLVLIYIIFSICIPIIFPTLIFFQERTDVIIICISVILLTLWSSIDIFRFAIIKD